MFVRVWVGLFDAHLQRRLLGVAVATVCCLSGAIAGGCADPGEVALDRVERGAEALIALAERRSRGELSEVELVTALRAWERTEGVEIQALAEETARALGPGRRAALEARWREVSERLSERLRAISADADAAR